MWTPATRRRHSREHLRYASDVSDEDWALLEPHLPAPCLTGRPRAWPMREIVNAIFYVLRSGCAWRLLPDSFPPRQTVYGWFLRLRDDCVLERLNHHLVMLDRAPASPSSPGAGSLSASSPGSAATAASPRTSRQPSNPPEPSSTPPPSCCSPDGSRNQDEFRVGLLADSRRLHAELGYGIGPRKPRKS